jgi:hypothetical protein
MVLLMATKLMTKSNFSGYSDNWKHDMLSYAITRVLTYCINSFENDRISIRTGNVTKAFSYITDTIKNAFIEVIKDRKEEQEFINRSIISLDDNSVLNRVYDSVEVEFKYEQLIVIFDGDYKERLIEKILKINPSDELILININEETKKTVEKVIKMGNEIGNHSFSYAGMQNMTKEEVCKQFNISPKRYEYIKGYSYNIESLDSEI